MNILSLHEDAEECVSDTWLKAWESIPPERPKNLKAWLLEGNTMGVGFGLFLWKDGEVVPHEK